MSQLPERIQLEDYEDVNGCREVIWTDASQGRVGVQYIRIDIAKERETELIKSTFSILWDDHEINESYVAAFYRDAGLKELE